MPYNEVICVSVVVFYRMAIIMNEFKPVIRFIVTSDIHYKMNSDRERERFERGMALAYQYASRCTYKEIDAFFAVGDFANSGSEEEYLKFQCSLNRVIKPETKRILMTASHEFKSGGVEASYEKLKRMFSQEPDNHIVIKGFHFISVSMQEGNRIRDEKKLWIETELASAAEKNPERPIFFFQHPHLSGTVYGSINWGEDDIISTLMNYPQIIDFSGHSHAPINDPRSIHQRHFTSCGTGSFSYFELDEFDKMYGTVPPDAEKCAQFLIVEADENNRVRIKPYDVISESFFPQTWEIDTPSEPESFIYTDERYHTSDKPHFDDNQTVFVSVNKQEALFEFKQAEISEDYVNDYLIRIRRKSDGIIVKQLCVWSSYYIQPMPDKITCKAESLSKGEYTVEVFARGFWNNMSVNKLSNSFVIG